MAEKLRIKDNNDICSSCGKVHDVRKHDSVIRSLYAIYVLGSWVVLFVCMCCGLYYVFMNIGLFWVIPLVIVVVKWNVVYWMSGYVEYRRNKNG